jgi:23S rRNA (cytidine2498-2'-O)-methyltransferase
LDKTILFLCQPGYSALLTGEMKLADLKNIKSGENWVLSSLSKTNQIDGLSFPHAAVIEANEVQADSVNAIVNIIIDYFIRQNEKIDISEPWSCMFFSSSSIDGITKRVNVVQKNFNEKFKKRMSRVSRLKKDEPLLYNRINNGLFVFFYDFDRFYISTKAFFYGQKRMKDDPSAPSRSYLKVEEAYYILGKDPHEGETVCDLGASPGGWSYSAAKRGAEVLAVDNGKLIKGALDDTNIKHIEADAFKFKPLQKKPYDWLFCDLVEHPSQVLELLKKWLENRWCNNFIINLKFGHVDPVALIKELNDKSSFLYKYCREFKIRHLYHDRDELTLTGIVRK